MVSTQNSWKQSCCPRNVSVCYKYFEFVNPGMFLQVFLFNFYIFKFSLFLSFFFFFSLDCFGGLALLKYKFCMLG